MFEEQEGDQCSWNRESKESGIRIRQVTGKGTSIGPYKTF